MLRDRRRQRGKKRRRAGRAEPWGAVARCYATGAVSGYLELGGLIGLHRDSTVLESFATGVVWGYKHLGGLVGNNDMSVVNDCYARGPVSGFEGIGGLVGRKA